VNSGADPERRELWKPPLWLAFAWGFAEATVFFIIPDVLLSWAALAGARDGLRALLAIVAGGIIGGLLMFGWASQAPDGARRAVESVPFVGNAMFERVRQDFSARRAAALLQGPGSGIPYKVYAVAAPAHCGAVEFALVSVPARIERLALSWIAFTLIGWIFKRWICAHRDTAALVFAIFWIIVYAIYWSTI
jgi:membrane protein YqaA with SNARE-associated domain